MNDKLKPLHDEDFEQWLKRTQASNLSSISKVAYLFIALEQLDTARTAFINIQNFIRDHNGSSWDGVRSFCKAALAKIGAGQPGLSTLIEAARRHVMSDEEKRAQRESFVYGNLKLDGCDVSREDVRAAMDKLDAEQEGASYDPSCEMSVTGDWPLFNAEQKGQTDTEPTVFIPEWMNAEQKGGK